MKIIVKYVVIVIFTVTMVQGVFGQQSQKLRVSILDFTNTGGLSQQETITFLRDLVKDLGKKISNN